MGLVGMWMIVIVEDECGGGMFEWFCLCLGLKFDEVFVVVFGGVFGGMVEGCCWVVGGGKGLE